MSVIIIEAASGKSLERAAALMAGVNGGIDRAMRSAMTRATSHLKTTASKKVRERYAISAGQMKKAASPKITYVMGNGIRAEILYRGKKIPLYKFDGAGPSNPTQLPQTVRVKTAHGWITTHPGAAAHGHVLRSTGPSTFENGFTARMPNGHTGLFERVSGSTKIKEIMGLSAAQMVGSDEYKHEIAEESMKKFEDRLDHEVLRLLGG